MAELTEKEADFLDKHPVVVGNEYRKAIGREKAKISKADLLRENVVVSAKYVKNVKAQELSEFIIDEKATLKYEEDAAEHKAQLEANRKLEAAGATAELTGAIAGAIAAAGKTAETPEETPDGKPAKK